MLLELEVLEVERGARAAVVDRRRLVLGVESTRPGHDPTPEQSRESAASTVRRCVGSIIGLVR